MTYFTLTSTSSPSVSSLRCATPISKTFCQTRKLRYHFTLEYSAHILVINSRDEEHIEEIVRLLSTTSEELLSKNDQAVGHLIETIHRIKSTENTWSYIFHVNDNIVDEQIQKSEAQLQELKSALQAYRNEKRLDVIRPFAKLFDPYGSGLEPQDPHDGDFETPSHRGLFWAFSYQSSLLGWSEALVDVFESVLRIEKKRRRPR